MVQAWLFNDDGTDQRSPHKPDPEVYIGLEELKHRTGVSYWKVRPLWMKVHCGRGKMLCLIEFLFTVGC